jgi:hypothetical protein
MSVDEQSLEHAVEDQARAYVGGELATFASYLTPQALAAIHATWKHSPPRSYEVLEVSANGDGGASVVRYRGKGLMRDLRQTWCRQDGDWKATDARVVAEERHGIARRLADMLPLARRRGR